MTKARVIAYQKLVGLRATGVADNAHPAAALHPGLAEPYPTLSYGMTSTAVKTLQAELGSLPTTGYFGSMTKSRVAAYQKFAGLTVTGVADNRTQQLLYTRGWSTIVLASAALSPTGGRDHDRLCHDAARDSRRGDWDERRQSAVATVSTATTLTRTRT